VNQPVAATSLAPMTGFSDSDKTTIKRLIAGDNGLATVSVARSDGSVHNTLVNAGITSHPVDGSDVVAFVVHGSAHKLKLLADNPHATVGWRVNWNWAAVDGPVELCGPRYELEGVDPKHVPGLLRQVFIDAGGSHEDWAEYDRVMATEKRTVVMVKPTRTLGYG
jgi:hypothetical protein